MSWVKRWRRKRIEGMVPHIKEEVLEHPELIGGLKESAKRDSRVMKLLNENGITIS